jgi:hypothetical protein
MSDHIAVPVVGAEPKIAMVLCIPGIRHMDHFPPQSFPDKGSWGGLTLITGIGLNHQRVFVHRARLSDVTGTVNEGRRRLLRLSRVAV